jgi:hypothetical protein
MPFVDRPARMRIYKAAAKADRGGATDAPLHRLLPPSSEGVLVPRNPMVGSLPDCCARATSGLVGLSLFDKETAPPDCSAPWLSQLPGRA